MPQSVTVITGGAGFLGSHLCDRFIAEGHKVIAIDNFITGNPQNIAHLFGNENFRFIKHDVTEFIYVDGKVDHILHFASPASPIDYLKLPIQTLKVGSLGTHKALGLAKAKQAKFLIASTSEVYGDPLVHPQQENYWGNVNPIGFRGVYDEAKRFAEAMTMAYHRYHGVDTRLLRIFNSILADELIYLFDDGEMRLETAETYWDSVESAAIEHPRRLCVPAFDQHGKIALRPATAFIKHASRGKDAFKIQSRYGRSIKVTGDHSVFVRDKNGEPLAKPARDLRVGEHLAILSKLPVIEKDRPCVDIARHLLAHGSEADLWQYALHHEALHDVLLANKSRLWETLAAHERFAKSASPHNAAGCAVRKYIKGSYAPVFVLRLLTGDLPEEVFTGGALSCYGSSKKHICNHLHLTPDVLWLLGLYVAEGTSVWSPETGNYYVSLASDETSLRKAKQIFETAFGATAGFVPALKGKSPQVYSHSRPLVYVLRDILGLPAKTRHAFVPKWILQLPLSRLKFFLEGYKDGDGTHSGKKVGHKLCFDTISETLSQDLVYLLMRFGIVGSLGKYNTKFKQKYGERLFPFYRVTVCSLSDFNILSWDEGVRQTLNARRYGDLVWSKITRIEPVEATEYVYDFSVETYENFVAGTGIMAHNTYGPRMRLDDGRALPSFVGSAIRGEAMTVYGDGSQTRSFCYVSDLVEGIWRLLGSNTNEPVNIGNPAEITILEFAKEVQALMKEMTGKEAAIEFRALPADDPKVRQPDITRAKELLGWQPKVNRNDGLRETIKYFLEHSAAKEKVGR